MKLILNSFAISFLLNFASQSAFADGFVCYSEAEQLQIQVYNHRSPSEGVRSPSVMIISDLGAILGEQTIAKFSSDKGELFANGARYFARPNSILNGDQINDDHQVEARPELAETFLLNNSMANLLELSLSVDFSYENPVENGETLDGVLELVSLEGDLEWARMSCHRYLRFSED